MALHVDSEGSDITGRMAKVIWVFVGRTCHFVGFVVLRLQCKLLKLGRDIERTFSSIWAPSSEFVSSSIPSWQILTAHAQPFRGAGDLAFCLKVSLDLLLVWASSRGSGETARMCRLAWTFAARIGDKYQIRLTRSNFIVKTIRTMFGGLFIKQHVATMQSDTKCLTHSRIINYKYMFKSR